jgi:hypothetical protein
MRTLLSNLLEKTAVMRVLSGNLRGSSGNNSGKTGNMEPMSVDSPKKSADTAVMSEDFQKMSLANVAESGGFALMSNDVENLSGDISAMSGDDVGMTEDPARKSGVIASALLHPSQELLFWLCKPFVRIRNSYRAHRAQCEALKDVPFENLFGAYPVPVSDEEWSMTKLRYDLEEMALHRYWACTAERGPRPYDKEMVLAFLIAFAVSLLRRFSTVARSVYNWQMPLHRSAAYSPRGSRPPPFTSVSWSAC